MPEGPECRKIAEGLTKLISRRRLLSIEVLSGRYHKKEISGLSEIVDYFPLGIAGAGVHGKFVYVILEKGYSIWNTLGMSGRWSQNNEKHARVKLNLDDGTAVYFVDQRNFGTLKFVAGKERLIEKLQSLGPDMLAEDISCEKFIEQLRKKNKQNVCKVVMDQGVIAGVGNYLKADSLWAAEINPFANVCDLSDDELSLLCEKIKELIRASYDSGGATINTYRDAEGKKGEYSSRFLVYNRKSDPAGNEIVREMTPDGRKTHWVPVIQIRGKK